MASFKNLIVVTFLFTCPQILTNLSAQEAKDKTGNWLMYWGANRVSKNVSIWTEAQYRLYEVVSNPNQLLLRTGVIYHLDKGASCAVGYAYVKSWPFEKNLGDSVTSNENRIWEQFVLKNKLWRIDFEHRYRLEHRWVKTDLVDYSTRARYRLLFTLPLTNSHLIPTTIFLAIYDEIFINISGGEIFDQNRLYFALGYQFSSRGQVQAGYLFQMLRREILERLQLAFVYNIDFSN